MNSGLPSGISRRVTDPTPVAPVADAGTRLVAETIRTPAEWAATSGKSTLSDRKRNVLDICRMFTELAALAVEDGCAEYNFVLDQPGAELGAGAVGVVVLCKHVTSRDHESRKDHVPRITVGLSAIKYTSHNPVGGGLMSSDPEDGVATFHRQASGVVNFDILGQTSDQGLRLSSAVHEYLDLFSLPIKRDLMLSRFRVADYNPEQVIFHEREKNVFRVAMEYEMEDTFTLRQAALPLRRLRVAYNATSDGVDSLSQ